MARITLMICDFVDNVMKEKNQTTATDLTKFVNMEFDEKLSVSKVKELRKRLGWVASKTKYCQMVHEAN